MSDTSTIISYRESSVEFSNIGVQCGDDGDPIKEHLRKWNLLEVGSYFQGGVQLINPGKINEMCHADDSNS